MASGASPAAKARKTKRPITAKPKRGTCRICGCTELEACNIPGGRHGGFLPCGWVDEKHTLCTNPKCVRKAGA